MKMIKLLTPVALFLLAATANASEVKSIDFQGKTFCQKSADSYDIFLFAESGKFLTINELVPRLVGNWTYNPASREITATFMGPPVDGKLQLTHGKNGNLVFKGKELTEAACMDIK